MLNLYSHQQDAVDFIRRRRGRAGLWMATRTGKSRVVLGYLEDILADRVLIVCPIIAASVWQGEIQAARLPVTTIDLTFGPIPERAAYLYDLVKNPLPRAYLIINWESYWQDDEQAERAKPPRKKLSSKSLRQAILKWRPKHIILDESHYIKNRSSKQARFAHTLGSRSDVITCLALSGTPVANGHHDLFSQYKFIDASVFGPVWEDFAARYIVYGGYGGYEIKEYRHEDEIQEKLRETSFSITRREAFGDEPREDIRVPIRLSNKAVKQYEAMRKEAIAEIEGTDEHGKPLKGTAIARITLTTLLRLQQMTSGFIETDTGTIDIGAEKLDATQELVEQALEQGEKVVIYCYFRRDIQRLRSRFPQAAVIYGGTSDRAPLIEGFKGTKYNVLIIQIRAAISIDLSVASVGIFYSLGYSLVEYTQSQDRLFGPKQTKAVTIYYLITQKTVDEKVYKALNDKQNIASRVTKLDYARRILS